MHRTLAAVLAAFLVATPLGAQSIDPTAATVRLTKAETISVKTLNAEIAAYETVARQANQSLGDEDRSRVLWLMIDRILFKQAAERDRVRVTQEYLQAAIEQSRQAYSLRIGRQATDADLRAAASQQGLTWEQWLEKLRESAIPEVYVSQMRASAIQNVEAPTETEIRRYYRANLKEFVIGDIVEFKHIFVATYNKNTQAERDAARKKIDEVAQKLRAGESFEDLVVRYSEDQATANKGGYAGHLQVDVADIRRYYGASFMDEVFDLQEAQISGVLQSSRGYHVIKIVSKIPGKLYGLDEKTPPTGDKTPRSAIRDAIVVAKRQETLANELTKVKQELRTQAKIDILDRNLGFAYRKPD
jgi:parvulin-like peptidyl-prolyl isomerase